MPRVRGLADVMTGAVLVASLLGPPAAPVSADVDAGEPAAVAEPIGAYLRALEQSGRLPAETATVERVAELVVEAESHLVNADARAATTVLFGVVESPRFQALATTAPYQNAEFLLGRALKSGRAHLSAAVYLARVLRRGPDAPYFVPAARLLVDQALDTGRLADVVQILAATPALPADTAAELAYLRGRVAYQAGDWDAADRHFQQVGEVSRLHPAALYFRGLCAVQRQQWGEARARFCRIADQKDQDRLSFNVDDRFFRLKDMARLALGRIAHEQDRYDEAYYFYFSIPEESQRLPSALFEASWSMLQKGEFQAARAFADQFETLFPHHALRPEISILRANLAVKTCAFDRAREEADGLVKRYRPVQALAARALSDGGLRDRLIERVLSGRGQPGRAGDIEGQLIEILELDPDFEETVAAIADLDVDIAEATRSVRLWRELGALAASERDRQPVAASAEAARLLEEAASLAELARRSPEHASAAATLVLETSLLAHPPEGAGPYAEEARAAERMARELAELRSGMIGGLRAMIGTAIEEADARLRAIMRQTRLVHIDATVGKKKKLEIELRKLHEGQLTAELFRKMAVEGELGDDEIYWPYEGEMWADEYENYR